MNYDQIKIFVINLRRSEERRKYIEKLMSKYSIDFEFFDAVDGKLLPEEVIEKSRDRSNKWYKEDEGPNESMKLGEIGVSMSHYRLYKKIIKENIDCAIIMEDDAYFDERLNQFIKQTKGISHVMKSFDVLLLGYCTHDLNYQLPAVISYIGRKKISNKFFTGIPLKWYWSAIGYVINKKGAILLSEKQGEYPCLTADILTANSPHYGAKLGVLSKPIVWAGDFSKFSTIQGDGKTFIPAKVKNKTAFKIGSFKRIKRFGGKIKQIIRLEISKLNRKHYLFIKDRY